MNIKYVGPALGLGLLLTSLGLAQTKIEVLRELRAVMDVETEAPAGPTTADAVPKNPDAARAASAAGPVVRGPVAGIPTTGMPMTGIPTTEIPTTGIPAMGIPAATLVPAEPARRQEISPQRAISAAESPSKQRHPASRLDEALLLTSRPDQVGFSQPVDTEPELQAPTFGDPFVEEAPAVSEPAVTEPAVPGPIYEGPPVTDEYEGAPAACGPQPSCAAATAGMCGADPCTASPCAVSPCAASPGIPPPCDPCGPNGCAGCEHDCLSNHMPWKWHEYTKPRMQASHWGYPSEFCERPFGSFVQASLDTQVANGRMVRMALYDYDFVDSDARGISRLTPRGKIQLRKITKLLAEMPAPIVVQRTPGNPIRDAARKQAVMTALAEMSVPVGPHELVVADPRALGMGGDQEAVIYQVLLEELLLQGRGFPQNRSAITELAP